MAPLPSFVELINSLGLQTDLAARAAAPYTPSLSPSRPSSPSVAPPRATEDMHRELTESASTQSDSPNMNTTAGVSKRQVNTGNSRATRFSPYAPATSRQVVATQDRHDDHEQPVKADWSLSSSRCSSGSIGRTHDSRQLERCESSMNLHIVAASYTPISSFARRHSPQTSPTAPSFSKPKHSRSRSAYAALPSPVMLPTLPPLLAESLAAFSSIGPASRDDGNLSGSSSTEAMGTEEEKTFVRHHRAGLRISSFHRQIDPVA